MFNHYAIFKIKIYVEDIIEICKWENGKIHSGKVLDW